MSMKPIKPPYDWKSSHPGICLSQELPNEDQIRDTRLKELYDIALKIQRIRKRMCAGIYMIFAGIVIFVTDIGIGLPSGFGGFMSGSFIGLGMALIVEQGINIIRWSNDVKLEIVGLRMAGYKWLLKNGGQDDGTKK